MRDREEVGTERSTRRYATRYRRVIGLAAARQARRGAVSMGCILMLVVPALLFGLALLWYDRAALTVSGVIVGKQEKVGVYTKYPVPDEPHVERDLLLHVRYTPPGSPEMTWRVRASPARYDAVKIGDAVSLHYLETFPRISIGLAERTARDRLHDLRAQTSERNGAWILWSLGGIALMVVASSFGNVAMLIVSIAWLLCAWPALFREHVVAARGSTATSAVIGNVEYVTHTPRWGTDASILDGRHLTIPYAEVELTYVPGPGSDSVHAVDAVDSASTTPLKAGAIIAIRYDRSSPRDAQLQRATRTFRSRNRFDMWMESIAPAVLGVIIALIGFKRRKRPAA